MSPAFRIYLRLALVYEFLFLGLIRGDRQVFGGGQAYGTAPRAFDVIYAGGNLFGFGRGLRGELLGR